MKLTRVETRWALVYTLKNGKREYVRANGQVRLYGTRFGAMASLYAGSDCVPRKVRVTVEET